MTLRRYQISDSVNDEILVCEFENENVSGFSRLDEFTSLVEKYCDDYLKKSRKKEVAKSSLSFVLMHLCLMVYEDEVNADFESVFDDKEFNRDSLFLNGNVFRTHKGSNTKHTYRFNGSSFEHKSLLNCLEYLEGKEWLVYEKGWNYSNAVNKPNKFQVGLEFINYPLFYSEFYEKIRDALYVILSKRKDKIEQGSRQYVQVRKSIEQYGQDGSVTKETVYVNTETEKLDGRSVIRSSKKLMSKLDEMYERMTVTLDGFDSLEEETKLKVRERWVEKKRVEFDRELLDKRVNLARRQLLFTKTYPYRVFHYDDVTDELTWGRIYGNKSGIDRLHKYLLPMLRINGKKVAEIDIKSCIPQLFVLQHCPSIDNKQDFYEYKKMKDFGLDREDVKLLTQCLINNPDRSSSLRSFRFNAANGRYLSMRLDGFNKIVDSMIAERKYLKRLFNVHNISKRMIRLESNFMVELIDELLSKDVEFVYHFDALLVPENRSESVIETIQKLAMKKWKRELRVEVS